MLIIVIISMLCGYPLNSRALLSFFSLSLLMLCQSVGSHVESYCCVFSPLFSAGRKQTAPCSTVCIRIMYNNEVHQVMCVFPFGVMFYLCFYTCILLLPCWCARADM
uniref:Putative secreted protein n=1 Tax=Amblyomma cajennense TaxID=34607 RepID=A0A023FDS0_AMBCJ